MAEPPKTSVDADVDDYLLEDWRTYLLTPAATGHVVYVGVMGYEAMIRGGVKGEFRRYNGMVCVQYIVNGAALVGQHHVELSLVFPTPGTWQRLASAWRRLGGRRVQDDQGGIAVDEYIKNVLRDRRKII